MNPANNLTRSPNIFGTSAQWVPAGGVVGAQRTVGALWAIAQAYAAAVLSLPRDRSTQGAALITIGALMAHCDVVLRAARDSVVGQVSS